MNIDLAYLKRTLENWDNHPMSDEVLKLTLKWIKNLEEGIKFSPWEDVQHIEFKKDTKNWRTCDCKEIFSLSNLKHTHRIYRTLEQAINELE